MPVPEERGYEPGDVEKAVVDADRAMAAVQEALDRMERLTAEIELRPAVPGQA